MKKKKIERTFLFFVLSRYGSVNRLTFAMPERSWMFSFKVQGVPIQMDIERYCTHRTGVPKIMGIKGCSNKLAMKCSGCRKKHSNSFLMELKQ